jgi:hypothetical protein
MKLKDEKKYLVGVTTACGMLDKSAPLLIWAERLTRDFLFDKLSKGESITEQLINEAIEQRKVKIDKASDIGTQIHNWIEEYITNQNPTSKLNTLLIPEDQNVAQGVIAFLDWVTTNKIEFIATEEIVYSRIHNYVGRFDAIIKLDGKLYLIDFKSSNGVYPEYRYQTSGYVKAYNEEHGTDIKGRMIIKLGKETGDFEAVEFDESELDFDFECFLGLLKLKEADKKYNTYYNK